MLSILFSFLVLQQVPATAPAEVGSDKPTQTTFNLDIATLGMASPKPHGGELYGVVHTSMGDITIHLFENEAPNTVANFVGLARGTREWKDPRTRKWVKRALYKNVLCHRVIPNFMIQCGDPTGTGTGTPGYTFMDEFSPKLRHNTGGLLSMANRGPNTNGSQFFITEVGTPHLDGRHTIFGEVIKNSELIGKIARVRVDAQDRPMEDVVINSIDVFRSKKLPK